MNREQFLNESMGILKPLFISHGHSIPDNVKLSCGFARGSRKAIGQCFSAAMSKGKHAEIFICPTQSDTLKVVDILAHELIHACYPLAGHKGDFRKCAKDIGLIGKMTSTQASDKFNQWTQENIIDVIGKYPHEELCDSKKKQSTRLIKCACNSCGFTIRVSRKWLEHENTTTCHACNEPLTQG
jgi:hypothetical protein